jgi:drug/metabolite transporter (DMT)-like permease
VSRRGAALFAAMCVIWGIPYLLIKVALRDLSPAALVFGRTALGAAVLLPLAAHGKQLPQVLRRWRVLLLFTAIEIALPWLLLSRAEQQLPSSLTGLLVATVPLISVGIARWTGTRERVTRGRLAGLLLGISGVALLLGFDVSGAGISSIAEVLAVATCYAIGPRILARWLGDLSGIAVTAAALTICAVGYLPFALATRPQQLPGVKTVAAVITLALVCTALAMVLFAALIGEVGPTHATVFTFVNPAVAVALGAAVLGEPVGAATVVGFLLILAGSVLATGTRLPIRSLRRNSPLPAQPSSGARPRVGPGPELPGAAATRSRLPPP